jgi:hypothetical protein
MPRRADVVVPIIMAEGYKKNARKARTNKENEKKTRKSNCNGFFLRSLCEIF